MVKIKMQIKHITQSWHAESVNVGFLGFFFMNGNNLAQVINILEMCRLNENY